MGWWTVTMTPRMGLAVVISHRLWQERFNLSEEIISSQSITSTAAPLSAAWRLRACRRYAHAGRRSVAAGSLSCRLAAFETGLPVNQGHPGVDHGRLNQAGALTEARAEVATLFAHLKRIGTWATLFADRRGGRCATRALSWLISATALLPIGDMAPVFHDLPASSRS